MRECTFDVGQRHVYDGCYNPMQPQPTPPASSILDEPSIVHAFFVLGAMVTLGSIAALLFEFYKPTSYEYIVARANDLAAVVRGAWRGAGSTLVVSLRCLRRRAQRQSPTLAANLDANNLLAEAFELSSSGHDCGRGTLAESLFPTPTRTPAYDHDTRHSGAYGDGFHPITPLPGLHGSQKRCALGIETRTLAGIQPTAQSVVVVY